jgi:hypothetical protein
VTVSTTRLRPVAGLVAEPTWVVKVDPGDGSSFVLRDTPVLVRLSAPVNPASVTHRSVRVVDASGPVPAELSLSADERVVIWCPQRLMAPSIEHELVVCGLLDRQGRPVPNYTSRFFPCGLARGDFIA